MKFKKLIKVESGLKQFDIAPLIDVVFLLLIFFMLTSNFMVQPGIRIKLPKTVVSQALKRERLAIIVSSEDLVYLNGKIVNDKELEKVLSSYRGKIKAVFIKADHSATMGRIVRIWDICKKCGINQINIATSRVEK